MHALCSPAFFDEFTGHADVTVAFANWEAAQSKLAGDVRGNFQFGGIVWEEYRGSDSAYDTAPSSGDLLDGEVGIVSGDCRFFMTGVPGMYSEYYAPADDFAAINTAGLPKYLRMAIDESFGKWVKLEVQSNPLPLVTWPETLIRGTFA